MDISVAIMSLTLEMKNNKLIQTDAHTPYVLCIRSIRILQELNWHATLLPGLYSSQISQLHVLTLLLVTPVQIDLNSPAPAHVSHDHLFCFSLSPTLMIGVPKSGEST